MPRSERQRDNKRHQEVKVAKQLEVEVARQHVKAMDKATR
jgi:hypothetical protein